VANRVGEYAKAGLTLAGKSTGPERQYRALGRVDIVNPYVQVQLLRVLGIRPARRDPPRRTLERQLTRAGLQTDDYPVVAVLVNAHAQDLRVEGSQRARIRAVKYGLLQPADHAGILAMLGSTCNGLGCIIQIDSVDSRYCAIRAGRRPSAASPQRYRPCHRPWLWHVTRTHIGYDRTALRAASRDAA
jgi:hypothetical protein